LHFSKLFQTILEMKETKHPKPVKVGQTSVRIYRYDVKRNRTVYTEFRVQEGVGAARKFHNFNELEKAKAKAKQIGEAIESGNAAILKMDPADLASFQRAQELANSVGVPIESAVADYVAVRQMLAAVQITDRLTDIVGEHIKRHQRQAKVPQITVTDAVDRMLEQKRKDGLSERHVQDLDSRLTKFAESFQCQLASLTGPQITAWLRALGLSLRSQNNYRMAIQTLVSHAKECGWLPRDWSELDTVKKQKEKLETPEIFTPTEIKDLLSKASDKLRPYVAIAAFAGVRQAELERLDWSKVDIKTGYITIDASIAKTNSRRVIPMPDNLKQWLAPHVKKQGAVCEYGNVTNALVKLAKAAGVEWKHNGPRHSFGSYRTAQTADVPRVSYEMGNSPAMVKQHYHGLATPETAAEWFAVLP
jgi:integrase